MKWVPGNNDTFPVRENNSELGLSQKNLIDDRTVGNVTQEK